MARVTIDLVPGETVDISVSADEDGWVFEEGPDPGEEEPEEEEEEYLDATGTGDRIYPFTARAARG